MAILFRSIHLLRRILVSDNEWKIVYCGGKPRVTLERDKINKNNSLMAETSTKKNIKKSK